VQVIGQQWEWTFRYPTYGGLETRDVAIPEHTLVALHVTSLDVTHSFWAYELGVKADAVPGVDNIAYVTARHEGFFQIRCAELCGLWHAHMAKKGRVLSMSAFQAWIADAQKKNKVIQKYLPPQNPWYYPQPFRRAG
jgi:cytochrome c oxidase subunit II